MSSLFGIFNRSGDPVDQEIARGMLEAASYWNPDDVGLISNGPVALGHLMLWNTPESREEQLPRQKNHMIITMDARLDNREELGGKLGIHRDKLAVTTDSELILASYHKWGEQCPNHLLGDFAFAIWNIDERELFCARDHLGIKPLYFSLSRDLFILGSDIKGLLGHPSVSRDISDEAVANFLVNWGLESPTLTFFREVEKIPPGHSITVSATGFKKRCYWQPDDAPRIDYADKKEYSARLRELLEQAVKDRIRSLYPISAHLSGGLDSSSIAVIAARILREEGKQLQAFNWLHEPGKNDDPHHYEWSNSKAIAEREVIKHHYVKLDVEDICQYLKQRSIACGISTTFWYEFPVREAVSRHGARTLLSGWGGDELASYHGHAFYADLLMHGRILKLLRALSAVTRKNPQKPIKRLLGTLYHHLFLVLVPRRLYCLLPRSHGCEKPPLPYVADSFRPFVEKYLRKPPILTMQPQRSIRSHMLAYLENGHLQDRIESWAAAARPNHLEYVYPLLDKRVVEFVLGVPASCFIGNGHGRHLFRSAVQDLLPKRMIWASTKEEPRRVDRLIAMERSCLRKLGQEMDPVNVCSQYIDTEKLFGDLRGLDDFQDFDKALIQVTELDTALAVLLSEELINAKSNKDQHREAC